MPTAEEIALAIFNLDGEIKNVFTSNTANTHVTLPTALVETYLAVKALRAEVALLRKEVAALGGFGR